jgi:hypothetical protein
MPEQPAHSNRGAGGITRAAGISLYVLASLWFLNIFAVADTPIQRQSAADIIGGMLSYMVWAMVFFWLARKVTRQQRFGLSVSILILHGMMMATGIGLIIALTGRFGYTGGRFASIVHALCILSWLASLTVNSVALHKLRRDNNKVKL